MSGTTINDFSPDGGDRVADFLARHGGRASAKAPRESAQSDVEGWSEIYAADGYTLRCDWSSFGSRKEMSFSEIPPKS